MPPVNPRLDRLLEKANQLPLLPGVYMMLDEAGTVIYVGKAKKLKNRVSSYFHGEHLPKVAAMVSKVQEFRVIIAASEFEALVLENAMIKQHKPHYNILLKDDKGYPFIRLDMKQEYPRLQLASRNQGDGAQYFGPFGSRGRTTALISELNRLMGLPDCSRRLPQEIGRERPCLNYSMGNCKGWCLPDKDPELYRQTLQDTVQILRGKSEELEETIRQQMLQAADEMRFEQAALLRDRLQSIQSVANRQNVISTAFADTDAVGLYRGEQCCFTVLHFVKGNLTSKDAEFFSDPLEENSDLLESLVRQYYMGSRARWPKTILLPFETDNSAELENLLSEYYGKRLYLEIPKRGERKKLSDLAMVNAEEEIAFRLKAEEKRSRTLEWLRDALLLTKLPHRIEAYDISNLGNSGIVAGMTVFADAKPCRSGYRRFRIQGLSEPNDYESMSQTLQRRFSEWENGNEKFSQLPDLLLIDGGQEHAAVAERVLAERKLTIPVFGMVKDDRHRTRALVNAAGNEINIAVNQAVFALVGTIQEETHRFAISYQKKTRQMSMRSELEEIPGIGEKRRNDLLKSFRSVKQIRQATISQLELVLPHRTAETVYRYYHPDAESRGE